MLGEGKPFHSVPLPASLPLPRTQPWGRLLVRLLVSPATDTTLGVPWPSSKDAATCAPGHRCSFCQKHPSVTLEDVEIVFPIASRSHLIRVSFKGRPASSAAEAPKHRKMRGEEERRRRKGSLAKPQYETGSHASVGHLERGYNHVITSYDQPGSRRGRVCWSVGFCFAEERLQVWAELNCLGQERWGFVTNRPTLTLPPQKSPLNGCQTNIWGIFI